MKTSGVAKAKRTLLGIEIPAGELAVRIAEASYAMKRAPGMTPEQALASMEELSPGMSDGMLRAAKAAVVYFYECINAGKAPH